MKYRLFLVFVLWFPPSPSWAQDALDLHAVTIEKSPPVADWAPTVRITRLDMDPRGGIALTFDAPLPDRWKFYPNPQVPGDNFQFTVWACVQRVYCAGFVQMWQGRSMTDGSLPAILSGYVNWWGDGRHLWDAMSDYRPSPGDEVDFLVTAGNARLTYDVTSVAERSNVVAIRLPSGDSGSFVFSAQPPPVIVPPYVPPVVPVPVTPVPTPVTPAPLPSVDLTSLVQGQGMILAQLAQLNAKTDALKVDVDSFEADVRSKWSAISEPIVKYVLPAITAYFVGKKL